MLRKAWCPPVKTRLGLYIASVIGTRKCYTDMWVPVGLVSASLETKHSLDGNGILSYFLIDIEQRHM